ncbi:peptidase inhibitor family I36 protein [Amycolatopsis sp. FDAARGOS 1241]|uniref:peptidase inhibitor family I36 protein n=1 Tax=Amycolatopsis sp. FDAARGOS 1241 TaxID=2778070 RepID=UPI00195089E5|nr:peptidase inhibitor family I36 protein [Amycolatopsis sp. FDAARGOS 1241]QRP47650.1 peptidase inhibitor family I36 protein [Amycolatopsis sp. FDAARGOS 1241]
MLAIAPATSAAGTGAAGHFCLFEGDSCKGQHIEFAYRAGAIGLSKTNWAGDNGFVANGTSSMQNNTSHTAKLFDSNNCTGKQGKEVKPNSVDAGPGQQRFRQQGELCSVRLILRKMVSTEKQFR